MNTVQKQSKQLVWVAAVVVAFSGLGASTVSAATTYDGILSMDATTRSCCGEENNVSPAADNMGLGVGGNGHQDEISLKFNVSAYSNLTEVISAKLIIRMRNDFFDDQTGSIFELVDTWDEATITANNQPAAGASLGTFDIPGTAGGAHHTAGTSGLTTNDVTAYVQSQLSASDPLISFRLGGGRNNFMRPKEHSNQSEFLPTPDLLPGGWAQLLIVAIPEPSIGSLAFLALGSLGLLKKRMAK